MKSSAQNAGLQHISDLTVFWETISRWPIIISQVHYMVIVYLMDV